MLRIRWLALELMHHLPPGEESPQLSRAQQKIRIHRFDVRPIIHGMDDGNYYSTWPHSAADGGEQITLQIVTIADQVKASRLDLKFVIFEIRYAGIYVQTPLPCLRPNYLDRYTRSIYGRNAPASLRQKQGVTARSARQVQSVPGLNSLNRLRDEWRRRVAEMLTTPVTFIPGRFGAHEDSLMSLLPKSRYDRSNDC